MPYLLFLKKWQNLQSSSTANYRWRLGLNVVFFVFADEEELDSEIKVDEKIFCNMIGPCGCELIHR